MAAFQTGQMRNPKNYSHAWKIRYTYSCMNSCFEQSAKTQHKCATTSKKRQMKRYEPANKARKSAMSETHVPEQSKCTFHPSIVRRRENVSEIRASDII
jgi:hypothetical protein